MPINPEKVQSAANALRRVPYVDETCIGCETCVHVAPEVFEMDEDEGVAIVKPCESYEGKDVDDAIAACPVGAISWRESKE